MLGCNEVVQCTASGWAYSTGRVCPMGVCALAYADITSGTTCTPQGLACAYPQGTCNCEVPLGGPVPLGAPIIIRLDGGVGSRWACFPPPSGCSTPRPALGTPPPQARLLSNYAPCSAR